jgi:hypothetical protein
VEVPDITVTDAAGNVKVPEYLILPAEDRKHIPPVILLVV